MLLVPSRAHELVHRRLDRARRRAALRRALRESTHPVRDVRLIENETDVLVAKATDVAGRAVIVKLATTARADDALHRHTTALDAFAAYPPEARALVPEVLHTGTARGRVLSVETALRGEPLLGLAGTLRPAADRACLAAIECLHRPAAARTVPDDGDLDAWLDAPLQWLRRRPELHDRQASLDALRAELARGLDRPLLTTRIHGDLALGNILVDGTGAVTGLVDFELSRASAPADLDHLQYALSTAPTAEYTLGDLTAAALHTGDFHPAMRDAGALMLDAAPNDLGLRTSILFAWLVKVADDLRKTDDFTAEWIDEQVVEVLDAADHTRAA